MSKVFLFPGQGSQYVGMGKEFYETGTSAGEVFTEAEKILGYDIKEVIFNGPEEELKKTAVTQPAVFLVEIIILKEMQNKGFAPAAAAGHSLGEYAAVVASGSLSWQEALELVKFRGKIFEQSAADNPGGMAAVIGLDEDKLENAISAVDGICEIVNYNSPGQLVISYSKKSESEALETVKQAGAKMVVPLKVSGGFHSSLMNDAVEPMREKINTLNFNNPEIAFYSNFTGKKAETADEVRDSLVNQVNSPVKWIDIVNNIDRDFCGAEYYELGPGKVIQGLLKRINRKLPVKGVSVPEDIN